MISRIREIFRKSFVAFRNPTPEFVPDMADVIIATRALRLHNRSREGAAKFQRVHEILKAGKP